MESVKLSERARVRPTAYQPRAGILSRGQGLVVAAQSAIMLLNGEHTAPSLSACPILSAPPTSSLTLAFRTLCGHLSFACRLLFLPNPAIQFSLATRQPSRRRSNSAPLLQIKVSSASLSQVTGFGVDMDSEIPWIASSRVAGPFVLGECYLLGALSEARQIEED